MSTSPEITIRTVDKIVNEISRWLAGHIGERELHERIDAIGTDELEPAQEQALRELLEELESGQPRAQVEAVARETLEPLALGI
jgi:hypothetical protein